MLALITYTAYHKPKGAPAVGEAALRDEIARRPGQPRCRRPCARRVALVDRHQHEKGRRRQLLRFWPFLRWPALRAPSAQSAHRGHHPDPRRQGAAFSRIEDRQRRRQVQRGGGVEGGGELKWRDGRAIGCGADERIATTQPPISSLQPQQRYAAAPSAPD